jgi:hypothetical protein
MKRKVRKFAEGKAVTTRSDDEIEFSSKNPYKQYPGEGWKEREKEQGEKNLESLKSFGRKLFGGGDDESKFSDLESVKKTKTLKEQIGRKDEEEPRRKITDYSTNKGTTSYVSKEDAPYEVEKTTPVAAPKKEKRREEVYPGPNDKRKTQPESTLPKKAVGEDAKPLPGVSKDKDKPKNLPGKFEPKSKVTPYSAPKKISKEEEAAIKKRAEQDDEDQEKLRKQLENNKKEATAPAKKKEEKKYGIGPYNAFAGIHKALSGTFSARSESQADRVAAAKAKKKEEGKKAGGSIKMAKGGSASSRGDGIAQRGKTRGKIY